ncbi:MAG: CobW family GTP-binding protein [Bacillota bacterium]
MSKRKEVKDLYIITGFLGSGKTTLLKKFAEKYENINTGVVINEFGKIGIDGKLIEKEKMNLIEINNGSIFCSCLENSFIKALIELLNYDELDKIFVETSGLSDPSNLDKIIETTRDLNDKAFIYKGSICVVNANNILKLINTTQAVEKQILFSDLIIINKTDLVDHITLKKAKKKIKSLNYYAKIIETSYCKFDLNQLDKYLSLEILRGKKDINKDTINKKSNRPLTYCFDFKEIVEIKKIIKFLKELSEKIFRVKGFIRTKSGYYYIDMIGNEINYYPLESKKSSSQLVILSREEKPIKDWVNSKLQNYIS